MIPPPLPTRHIERPRCLARLEAGRQPGCALTLLHGEAGSGKTTLLSDYAQSLSRPVAWLRLTSAEQDPSRLLPRLLEALQLYPGLSSASAERLPEQALAHLLAELGSHADLVLMLDEMEALGPRPASLDMLKTLLANFPAAGQLIWSGRSLPAIPLASLRLNSRLAEMKGADLAFTPDEIMAWADHAESASIWNQTRGWAAGVSFLLTGGMPHQLLYDYMVEEILLQAPLAEQEHQLQAAFGSNLLWPSGMEPPPLWREALQQEACRRWDDQTRRARLLEQASASTDPLQAIGLLQKAAAWSEAIALIHRHSERLISRERLADVKAMLEGFPASKRASSAWLGYLEGRIARDEGQLGKALDSWERALSQPPSEAHPAIHMAKAFVHAERGELERMEQDYLQAQQGEAAPDMAERARLQAHRAYVRNDLASAMVLGKEALRLHRQERSQPGIRQMHNLLGLVWHAKGQLELAISHLREAEAIDELLGCCVDPLLYDLWAQCELALGRMGEGLRLLEKGRELSERLGDQRAIAHHLRTLGRFHLGRGESERARALFADARSKARALGDPVLELRSIWGLAQVHVHANRLQEAERLLTFACQSATGAPSPVLAEGQLLLAEVWGKTGREELAITLLDELEQPPASPHLRFLVLQLRQVLASMAGEPSIELQRNLRDLAMTHGLPEPFTGSAAPRQPSLDIRLLGTFAVKVEGRLLTDRDWQSSNAKLVLAYLLFHPSGVDKENLRKLLFPAHQPARSAVHMVINRLRSALEPQERRGSASRYILYQDGRYRLNPELEIRCDALDLANAMGHARSESGESRLAALNLAADLFQGVFLKDFLGIEWCAIERERLRQLGNEAYRQLFHYWTERREWGRLESRADMLLAAEPWHPLGVHARLIALAFQQRKEEALSWIRLAPGPDERTLELKRRVEREELTIPDALQELA